MAIKPKMQTFESSGVFRVTAGKTYKVIAVGGGAAGNYSCGGNSGLLRILCFTADADEDVYVTVGQGGGAADAAGYDGGASSFGSYVTALGGTVIWYRYCVGGNGINGNGGNGSSDGTGNNNGTLNGGAGGAHAGGGGGGWGGGRGGESGFRWHTSGGYVPGGIGGGGYGGGGGGGELFNGAANGIAPSGKGGDGVVMVMWY